MAERKNMGPDFNEILFYYWKLLIDEKSRQDEDMEHIKDKLQEEIKKNRNFRQEMVQSSVAERWKIGEYLHDRLAQNLVSIKIMTSRLKQKVQQYNSEVVDEFNEILENLDHCINEARDLSHDILPIDIEKEGISRAFKLLKVQARRYEGVNCTLETSDIINKINNREIATNLYHIAQEAIQNAIKHGEASNIKVAVCEDEHQLYLSVKDDGKGFSDTNKNKGMGIHIMKHRTEEMGGSFSIENEEENDEYSTSVICTLPVNLLESDDS